LAKKRRNKKGERQENYRTTGHCEPKANQSHPPFPHRSCVIFPPLPWCLPARSRSGEGRGEGEGEGENFLSL
jgi:hypothetical protein